MQWEYRATHIVDNVVWDLKTQKRTNEQESEFLDRMGEDGWELTAVVSGSSLGSRLLYLKRPRSP